jgi:hypothetical protein
MKTCVMIIVAVCLMAAGPATQPSTAPGFVDWRVLWSELPDTARQRPDRTPIDIKLPSGAHENRPRPQPRSADERAAEIEYGLGSKPIAKRFSVSGTVMSIEAGAAGPRVMIKSPGGFFSGWPGGGCVMAFATLRPDQVQNAQFIKVGQSLSVEGSIEKLRIKPDEKDDADMTLILSMSDARLE